MENKNYTATDILGRPIEVAIKERDNEYQQYLDGLAKQKEDFIKINPDFPYIDCMFLPVRSPRMIVEIRHMY